MEEHSNTNRETDGFDSPISHIKINGAIAQLVERYICNVKVWDSSSHGSTMNEKVQVCNEFSCGIEPFINQKFVRKGSVVKLVSATDLESVVCNGHESSSLSTPTIAHLVK